MAAGLGFKDFVTGEVLTAADVDGYLMQGVWVFASAAARDAAVTSPQEGNFAYLKDTNVTTYYTGSAWANLDTTGMTNPMTTTGDTIYSSSGSTPARLGIGSTGNVLTVAGGVPTWAAPAGGAAMAQIATGSLSGSSINFTSLTAYNELLFLVSGATWNTGNDKPRLRINGNTGNNYSVFGVNTQLTSSSNVNTRPTTSLATSSFQLAVYTFAKRNNADNIWVVKLTNCKTAGFTDIDIFCKYNDADYDYPELETTRGVYAVSETVSSLEFSTNSTLTFTAGTYTLWGA